MKGTSGLRLGAGPAGVGGGSRGGQARSPAGHGNQGPPCSVLTGPHLNSDPQDPKERLGCRPQTGFSDIKSHAFFRSIDWDLVKQRGI